MTETSQLFNEFEQVAQWWPLVSLFFGLILGSYLNAVAWRWIRGGQAAWGSRSKCPTCKHQLTWLDLIPIVSFVLLKGQCRYCHKTISLRYFLIEVVTGIIFLLLSLSLGWNTITLISLIFASVLIVISLIDFESQIIPDKLVFTSLVLLVFYFVIFSRTNLIDRVGGLDSWWWGIIISGGIIALIVLITGGRGMGGGDIKLAALIGASLGGVVSLVALMIAFVLGSLVGSILISFKKANRKTAIAFGPFLSLGWLVAILWHEEIISWYNDISF